MRKVTRFVPHVCLLLGVIGILAVSTLAEGGGPVPWEPSTTASSPVGN